MGLGRWVTSTRDSRLKSRRAKVGENADTEVCVLVKADEKRDYDNLRKEYVNAQATVSIESSCESGLGPWFLGELLRFIF
jgi:hypothetical protein